jgi:hypothetical protein
LNLSLPHLNGNALASHELTMNASDIQRFANSLTQSAWKCRLHFSSVVWYNEVLLLGFQLFQRIAPKKKIILRNKEKFMRANLKAFDVVKFVKEGC